MRDAHGREPVEPMPAPAPLPVESIPVPVTAPKSFAGFGGPDGVLALQRTAGNGAVVRMLAQRQLGAPVLQRSIEGYEDLTFEQVCKELATMEVDVSSPRRRAKLKELFDADKRYDLGEVLDALEQVGASSPTETQTPANATSAPVSSPSATQKPATTAVAPPKKSEKREESDEDFFDDEYEDAYADESWFAEEEEKEDDVDPEVLQELGQDVQAVVVWAGSKLFPSIIKELQAQNIAEMLSKSGGSTQEVAERLGKAINFSSEDIHQALDQELDSHTKAIQQIVARLGKFGIQPTVLRPTDELLLVPKGTHIDPTWSPYGNPKQLSSLKVPSGVKTLLITVGHGADSGKTAFPGTVKTGLAIATELKLDAPAEAFMYIPLQCFPQAAVDLWKTGMREKTKKESRSVSIPRKDKSDDNEMLTWIQTKLQPALIEWLAGL